MNKIQWLLALTVIISFSACKKDKDPVIPGYTCTTCATTPDALAANDGSSKGIYKGIVLGSSGTIMFDIANNGTTITAVMVLDGVTVNLTSSVAWVAGQPYVADFTGILNGSPVTINFSVDLSGGTPTITSSNIPGHPSATLAVVKETSSNLVECFEGTYSTTLPETGTFNIIILRSAGIWGGVARITGGDVTDDDDIDGTVSNNQLTMQSGAGPIVVGTLNLDQLNGSFVDSNNSTVTVTGRRTL
ncbi:MAG TPA: hypothetical protein PLC48_13115 [Ferruginibacter sp.]|nr:hypothetical protein [Ferruginibacter sp.]